MASSTRKEKIINSISPAALIAIVIMNMFLVYTNFEILVDIAENTEIALENQQLGLNMSQQNNDMLERVLVVQKISNDTLFKIIEHASNRSSNLP